MKAIRVLLAEDHVIVREGLVGLLKMDEGIEVVGEADDGRKAVALVKTLSPDVVLMDIAMPSLNGMEATRQILQFAPSTKVLVLSAHSDDAYVSLVMAIGASGFISKHSGAHLLSKAIREVHKGNTFSCPRIAARASRREARAEIKGGLPVNPGVPALTPREREVLQLIAEGSANKQTAEELGVSIKTVEKHRQHLMEKLDIHDTAGLTRYAIATGMIESGVQVVIS